MAKYQFMPLVQVKNRTWPDKRIVKAPAFCSVDLRDGNQALAQPMNVSQKLKLFELLVAMGFKEIEVGFPSASQIEFDFMRLLIDEKRVPDDVSIQILTQARRHLIDKSFESFKGVKKAVVHLYNSTSPVQRKVTFRMSKQEILDVAVAGVRMVKENLSKVPGTEIVLQYSPESFSNTETDYALAVCEAVMNEWDPVKRGKVILNLPATVETQTPNVYADMVEWFCQNLPQRDQVIVSLHTHNDRGTGIAAGELGLLAGADRIEGTLFGNGERTGNMDVVTLALNLFSEGIHPGIDVFNIPHIRRVYEECTGMPVPPRHPYAGDLVFTAFSGSHQDAIKKGLDLREANPDDSAPWEVPYLLIDPKDIGRSYEAIIRINSQSGKGGVAYILKERFGYELPKALHPEIGTIVNAEADKHAKELDDATILSLFEKEFVNRGDKVELTDYHPAWEGIGAFSFKGTLKVGGKTLALSGQGNGPIDAFVHALNQHEDLACEVIDFHEHSIGKGSGTNAVSYMLMQSRKTSQQVWGVGIDSDIAMAGIKALTSALNRFEA